MKQKEIENLSNSDTLTSIQLALSQLGFLNHWKMYFPVSSYGNFSCNFWWTKTLSVPDISPLCQNFVTQDAMTLTGINKEQVIIVLESCGC